MTTLRQAAEIALEALGKTMGVWGGTCAWHNDVEEAITTLKEALAQHQIKKCEAGPSLQDLWDCWDAVHSGKQEPTAWMDAVGDLTFRTPSVKLRPYWTPLYLHPTPVPEGWQLVPNEPTPKMCHAAFKDRNGEFSSASQWSAMLAAAPKYEE